MRIHKLFTVLLAALALLAVLPASGSPSLLLGSSAAYQLNSTTTRFDSCTSTNITVAAVACGSTVPFQTSAFVVVNDDTRCFSSNDTACNFNPRLVTVSVSGTVTWDRGGGNLTHTVTSDTGLFDLILPGRFNFSATNPSFTFPSAGTFSYHCNFHPWMKGQVVVIQPTPIPPSVQSFSLSGPVGWTVTGLDDNAQLELNHKITAYNSTATPPNKLYNESGIAQESIELSTRKDSSFNPFGFLYNLPFPTQGLFQFPSGPGYYFYNPPEVYTVWWVNGPLKAGSTIEVLTIHAAVNGSESVSLGSSLGSYDTWLVSYVNSEAFNQTEPSPQSSSYYCYSYPPYPYPFPGPGPQPIWTGQNLSPVCYTSGSSSISSLRLNYGQKSDLLFNLEDTTDSYTQTTTVYPGGSFVYGNYYYGPGYRVSSSVKVVRTSRSTFSTSLKLTGTSVDLSSRTIPPATTSGGSTSSPLSSNASAWMYGTVSVVAAALVGIGVWAATKARRKDEFTPDLQPPQQTV